MNGIKWVACENGAVPEDSVQGGHEADGTPLYVGRGEYENGVHIGKVAPHLGGLLIAYGGKEIKLKKYEVLTGDEMKLRWLTCSGPNIPDGWVPIEAGYEDNGRKLYVARVEHGGGLHIGKAGLHLVDGVSFPYNAKELTAEKYWVLVHL
jgi:hypothetical protein